MINHDSMRFGAVIFQINPEKLSLNLERRAGALQQDGRSALWDTGMAAGRITCKGCFFGSGAEDSVRQLAELMNEGQVLPLAVPGWGTTPAKLIKMEYEGKKGFEKAGYTLEFIDLRGFEKPGAQLSAAAESYVALGGESLWEISLWAGIGTEELMALNPQVKHINWLEKGELLCLR